jgi:hypothetical protein
MCGPRARTNFPADANGPPPSFLSAALVDKLHRFNLASVQAAQRQREAAAAAAAAAATSAPATPPTPPATQWGGGGRSLEEQHVEQMIEELLDSDFSMEICC